jgi:hypothetical protein
MPSPLPPPVKRERESKPFAWLNLVAIKFYRFSRLECEQRTRVRK